jgi:hypothetical protein
MIASRCNVRPDSANNVASLRNDLDVPGFGVLGMLTARGSAPGSRFECLSAGWGWRATVVTAPPYEWPTSTTGPSIWSMIDAVKEAS